MLPWRDCQCGRETMSPMGDGKVKAQRVVRAARVRGPQRLGAGGDVSESSKRTGGAPVREHQEGTESRGFFAPVLGKDCRVLARGSGRGGGGKGMPFCNADTADLVSASCIPQPQARDTRLYCSWIFHPQDQ